jgi:CheY-like chemotaxis protein
MNPVGTWKCPATKQGGNDMRKRILVVDDDSMNLVRTKMILGQDYVVLVAESGIAALEKLKVEKVDMVLLDIDMPGMNGIETFEQMKDLELDIPVIFLTASGLEEDVVSAIRLGAVNYLKKPFRPKELLRRVTQEFEKQ